MGLFDWLFGKRAPAEPPETPAGAKNWQVGDRVLAKWYDSFFYPGQVRKVQSAKCEVHFDDGDVAWVHPAHIMRPDIAVGSKVFSRVGGGPAYYPATVSQQNGEKIHVRYDHGDEEWTTLSLVRVQRPIVNVGGDDPALAPPAGPAKQAADLGEPIDEGNWRVGDRVLARWIDFYWYPGTIVALGSKGFQILYDDGDQRIVREPALMPLLVEEGEPIFIRPKSEPERVYSPATVTRVAGETLDVEYEDGHAETNTRVSRAHFWRCPVRVTSLAFEEGDRVLALDSDDCAYPAEIVTIQDDRVIVHFLDGPERMLTPELIRKFDLRVGSKVESRWKGGPNYFPGAIAQVDGDRVFIRYDDGDQEWTSIRLVRIAKPTI